MKNILTSALFITAILTTILTTTASFTASADDKKQAQKSAPTDMNALLGEYNKCYAAALELENKKAEPNLDGLETRVCRKEHAALDAALSPGLKQMLQNQAAADAKAK
jgi:hypothetical protein